MTAGAEVEGLHLADPCVTKLDRHGALQVEERTRPRCASHDRGIGGARHRFGDLLSHLVAARSDGWPDPRDEPGSVERRDGSGGDAGDDAAPSGVDRREGATLGVVKGHGHAVGGGDGESQPGLGGGEGVALTARPGSGGQDRSGVDLTRPGEPDAWPRELAEPGGGAGWRARP